VADQQCPGSHLTQMIMYMEMKSFIALITIFFIMACSSSEKVVVKDEQQKPNPYDESFDPNSLNDDDIVIGKYDVTQNTNNKKNEKISISQEQPQFKEVKGFRVQIMATKSIETATLAEQEAKDLFENMNHRIYLIFDAPLYKLRVGDVTTRDAAEEIRDIAKDYGYREAFIVPSKVNISASDSQ
jgi:uncharacterized protein YcfL